MEGTVGVPLLARGGRGLFEQNLFKKRTLVAVSAIWVQLPRRQVAAARCVIWALFFS